MKNPKKLTISDIMPYVLSFVIPAVIMGIAFFSLGIYPGGKMLLLTYDLKAELLPLYGALSNHGPGYDTFLHSMSGGLGGGFWGTIALYLSPMDLIYSFVPVRFLPVAVYFMVLFKIGLCSLFMHVFLCVNGRTVLPSSVSVVLSCCYGLMSYNVMYFISPMWYDGVMILPLLALCLEKVIAGKKSPLFVILMTYGIISDYYIAYMIVIALVIYCLFRLSEDRTGLKPGFIKLTSFAVHGIISAGLSMFVIIPVVLDFGRGKIAEGDIGTEGNLFKNSLFDVLKSFKSQSYSGLGFDSSPNIFCGSIVLILVVLWLLSGKKNIRARVSGAIIISFYFISFIFGPLDRAWHGFRDPVCFSVRYAFTFVFFLICFAARGYLSLSKYKFINSSGFGLFRFILIAYTFAELLFNSSYILACIGTESGYSLSSEYMKLCDVQENLVPYDELSDPVSYGRVISDYKYSNFDGSLFGYDGISRFSSSYNYKTHSFFRSMGLNSIYHSLGEKGMTPPLAGLIGAGYVLSYWVDLSDVYDPIKTYDVYTLYENPFSLPLAYEVNTSCIDSDSDFSDDPFDNLNTVYTELFAEEGEEIELFVPVEIKKLSDNLEYSFTTSMPGRYYMFVEYKYDEEDTLDDYEGDWEFMKKRIIRNYVFDEIHSGEYGNNQYSYIVDLGLLEGNREYCLSLESSASEEGEVYICCLDESLYEQVISSVNGAKLLDIGKNGIYMNASVNKDSELLMTLPYEKGYSVYIDGEKTEYGSYRDCIMLIPLKAGDHEIVINYFPPGLKAGIVLSIISFIFGGLLLKKRTYFSYNS